VFKLIERYQPQNIELDFKLKPFIPDYIPSIGDIDAFLKVPRPDGKADNLGLTVVDEPSSNQSDPHVLDLFFRTLSKQTVEVTQPTVTFILLSLIIPKLVILFFKFLYNF
jgi:intraflagellar transport protein 46